MSEVCKFCHFLENGDCPDDQKYLLDEIVKFNKPFGVDEEGISINGNLEIRVRIQANIWTPSKALSIAISTSNEYCDFIDLEAPINYCPICGKKLSKEGKAC